MDLLEGLLGSFISLVHLPSSIHQKLKEIHLSWFCLQVEAYLFTGYFRGEPRIQESRPKEDESFDLNVGVSFICIFFFFFTKQILSSFQFVSKGTK